MCGAMGTAYPRRTKPARANANDLTAVVLDIVQMEIIAKRKLADHVWGTGQTQ
jgi:hypothetical protein